MNDELHVGSSSSFSSSASHGHLSNCRRIMVLNRPGAVHDVRWSWVPTWESLNKKALPPYHRPQDRSTNRAPLGAQLPIRKFMSDAEIRQSLHGRDVELLSNSPHEPCAQTLTLRRHLHVLVPRFMISRTKNRFSPLLSKCISHF